MRDRFARLQDPCPFKVGDRIELERMENDPDPIPVGTRGTVAGGNGLQVYVDWDNGRTLMMTLPEDKARLIG